MTKLQFVPMPVSTFDGTAADKKFNYLSTMMTVVGHKDVSTVFAYAYSQEKIIQ